MELSSLSPLLRFFVIQEDKPSLTFLGRGNRLSRAACSAVSQAASLRLWFSGTKKVSGSSPPAWGRPLEERTVTGNASAEKVAIVTASGSGMGAACARELAQRGYAVALMSTSGKAEALAKELGGIGLTGSVTEEADLEALVGGTLERYGRVDAVINSTGHPASGEVLELTDGQWHEALDLVVLNVVRIARLVTPAMLRLGAIVNVSTFSAFEPSPTFPLSSSLRAALAGFSKLYADRYAADGVSMNNVLPGYIESFEIDEETRGRYRCGGGARSKRSRRPWRSSCHPMPLT
jgi:NAD(P)-dependent dehydrogenase (short-subunit alcohol dehydrogenase family)